MAHSLALLEHMHFPTLPQETRVHFIPQPRSLVGLLEPEFVQHLHKVQWALEAVKSFDSRFRLHYSDTLHHDTADIVKDSILILEPTVELFGSSCCGSTPWSPSATWGIQYWHGTTPSCRWGNEGSTLEMMLWLTQSQCGMYFFLMGKGLANWPPWKSDWTFAFPSVAEKCSRASSASAVSLSFLFCFYVGSVSAYPRAVGRKLGLLMAVSFKVI